MPCAQNDNEGVHALAKHRARLGDDGRLDDRGVVEQDVLDLGGENLVAAAVDDVLDAVDHTQVAAVHP